MADALYNRATWIRGEGKVKWYTPDPALACKAGDLLVLTAGLAALASTLADSGTLAQNQEACHDVCIGRALDACLAGKDRDIAVVSAGEHCSPTDDTSTAYNPGDFIGPAGTGAGLAVGIDNVKVIKVTTAVTAIGKVSKPKLAGDGVVFYELLAPVSSPVGGPQEIP